MEDMNITSAQWVDSEQTAIEAIIDSETVFVAASAGNRHYDEILRQVSSGDLTIADAD